MVIYIFFNYSDENNIDRPIRQNHEKYLINYYPLEQYTFNPYKIRWSLYDPKTKRLVYDPWEYEDTVVENRCTVTAEQLLHQTGLSHEKEVLRLLNSVARMVIQKACPPDVLAQLCAEYMERISSAYSNLLDDDSSACAFSVLWAYENWDIYIASLGDWLEPFCRRVEQEFLDYENKNKIRRAVQYIQQNYHMPLNMAVVSNQISMNYSLFSLLFKQYTGSNFVTYLQSIRIEEAKKLMEAKQKELESIEKELQKAKRSNSEKEKELGQFEEKKVQFEKQLGVLNEQTAIWTSKIAALRKKTWENTKELDEEPEANEANEANDAENDAEKDAMDVEPSRDIESEMLRIIPNVSEDELQSVDKARVERSILRLESERDHLKKTVNLGAIAEFRQKDKEYRKREKELDAITNERDRVRKEFDDLRKKRLTEFMDGFNTITLKLKEMYQMITLGGDAELELVDSLDPFAEGIVFSVRPPKKSWKNISNLSGGEKTLSSLALVFALHHYKPTPLYIMDEIDAALDFRNVSIVAHYIKERTKNAQFIVISLRNNMFEMANRLVGIYKTDNCTDSVAINPQELGNQM